MTAHTRQSFPCIVVQHTHAHTAQATRVSFSASLAQVNHQKFKFYLGKTSEQDPAALHTYLRRSTHPPQPHCSMPCLFS